MAIVKIHNRAVRLPDEPVFSAQHAVQSLPR